MADARDEPLGVTAVLLPGDPTRRGSYVERQVADLAAKLDVPVEEVTHGGGELLWVEMPDLRERLIERVEGALGDADLEMALAIVMAATGMDGAPPDLMGETGMDGRPGFAAGRAGDFIIAGVTQADVTEIIDVIDGTTDSLADSAEAQQVAAELPAERCRSPTSMARRSSMPWVSGCCKRLQAMSSPAEQAVWQSHSGLPISAVEPGFRFDAMTVPGEEVESRIRCHRQRSGHRGRRRAGSGRHVPLSRPAWFPRTPSPVPPTCWHWPSTVRWPGRSGRATGSTSCRAKRRWRRRSPRPTANPRFRSQQRAVRSSRRRVHRVLVISHIRRDEWTWARRGGRGHDDRPRHTGRDRWQDRGATSTAPDW